MVYMSFDPNVHPDRDFCSPKCLRGELEGSPSTGPIGPSSPPPGPPLGVGVLESISGGFNGHNIPKWSPDKDFEKKEHCLTPDPQFFTTFLFFMFALSQGWAWPQASQIPQKIKT